MASKHTAMVAILVAAACVVGYVLGDRHFQARQTFPEIVRDTPSEEGLEESEQSAEPPKKTEQELNEEALYAPQELNRNNAFQELKRRRQEDSDKLIKVVDKENSPALSRDFAVRLLGLRRDPAAIPVLIKHLDWQRHAGDRVVTNTSWLTGYPCAEALARIGSECTVALLLKVARAEAGEMNNHKIWLRARLLESMYSRPNQPWEGDDAIGVVERYIERIPPDWKEARAQVGRLLEELKAEDKRPKS